jgi:hypothetical protein
MKLIKRARYIVDPKLQGAIVLRAFAYWLACLVFGTSMLIIWRTFTGPARVFYLHFDDLWFHYSPIFVAWLFLLPVLIIDAVRFSNRFAGPIFRLRRCLNSLARNELVQPIAFRQNDFWKGLDDEFNVLLRRVQADQGHERNQAREEEMATSPS